MDIRLSLMCGTDIPIIKLQSVLHQPTIKEISYIGEEDFFTGIQCLCIDKSLLSQGEIGSTNINNFQIFMMMMQEKQLSDKKDAVLAVLSLLFPTKKVVLTPRAVVLNSENDTQMLDENNFEDLQEIIKQVFCLGDQKSQQLNYNPSTKKAKEIADKLMRGRRRAAELNGTAKQSVFGQYLSILTIGLGSMSMQNLMELTMYQIFDLVERYQLYINWDIDIRARMAGAQGDGDPVNWMKNIH